MNTNFVKFFVFHYINKTIKGLDSYIDDSIIVNNDEDTINKKIKEVLADNRNRNDFGGFNIVNNKNEIIEIVDSYGKRRKLNKEEVITHRKTTFPPNGLWKMMEEKDCLNCSCNKNRKCNAYNFNKTFNFNPSNCRVLRELKGAFIMK